MAHVQATAQPLATTVTIEVQKQTATAPEQLPCPFEQRSVVVRNGPPAALQRSSE
jgi:hypothetical protein